MDILAIDLSHHITVFILIVFFASCHCVMFLHHIREYIRLRAQVDTHRVFLSLALIKQKIYLSYFFWDESEIDINMKISVNGKFFLARSIEC